MQQEEQQQQQQSIKEFELINIPVNDIELDPTNPNVMSAQQMAAMRKSMQQYGYLVPVILDKNNKICDGEHRVLVYRELGLKTIPAYKVDLDSDTDRKQLRQIMNKLHGQHDRAKDADEFLEILKASQDGTLSRLSELIAQPQEQLLSLIKYFHPEAELQDGQGMYADKLGSGVDETIESVTQLGDIWSLGGNDHRIYCGDNIQILRTMVPDNSIDMTITSPPYDDMRKYMGFSFDFHGLANELYRVTKPGGVVVWNVGDQYVDESETLTSFKQAIYFNDIGFKVHDTMIWKKGSMLFPTTNRYTQCFDYVFIFSKDKPPNTANLINDVPTSTVGHTTWHHARNEQGQVEYSGKSSQTKPFRTRDNIWEIGVGFGQSTKDKIAYQHPAIFPEQLVNDHIRTWTNKDSVVLDPFLGSGTTTKIAEILGRRSIGTEISPKYVDIAVKRWEEYTHRKAERKPADTNDSNT